MDFWTLCTPQTFTRPWVHTQPLSIGNTNCTLHIALRPNAFPGVYWPEKTENGTYLHVKCVPQCTWEFQLITFCVHWSTHGHNWDISCVHYSTHGTKSVKVTTTTGACTTAHSTLAEYIPRRILAEKNWKWHVFASKICSPTRMSIPIKCPLRAPVHIRPPRGTPLVCIVAHTVPKVLSYNQHQCVHYCTQHSGQTHFLTYIGREKPRLTYFANMFLRAHVYQSITFCVHWCTHGHHWDTSRVYYSTHGTQSIRSYNRHQFHSPEPWVMFLVSVSPYFPRMVSGCESLALNTLVGPINSLHFAMAFSLASMWTSDGPLVKKNK